MATGTAVFIGAPVFDVTAIWTVFAVGEFYGVSCKYASKRSSEFLLAGRLGMTRMTRTTRG